MTDDLDILLSDLTTIENKTTSAKNLINTYNLSLEIYEILEAFDVARNQNSSDKYKFVFHKFVFHKLLDKNVNMFVAIIKSMHNNSDNKFTYNFFVDIDFDFNNSFVPEECKTAILEYKNNKYGGKLTKVAMN